jgi:hypothetical protein
VCVFQHEALTHQSLKTTIAELALEAINIFLPHLIDNDTNDELRAIDRLSKYRGRNNTQAGCHQVSHNKEMSFKIEIYEIPAGKSINFL